MIGVIRPLRSAKSNNRVTNQGNLPLPRGVTERVNDPVVFNGMDSVMVSRREASSKIQFTFASCHCSLSSTARCIFNETVR